MASLSQLKKVPLSQKVIMGVELESYTILIPDHRVSRQLAFPRKGTAEKGENFRRDSSIGTEYNSRPFSTIREGLFLIKAGLRKYSGQLYRSTSSSKEKIQLLLTGGWRDRYAGAHIHLSIQGEKLNLQEGRSLASYLHDYIPLFIAVGANSPVWGDKLTRTASNRISKASSIYFKPIKRKNLANREMDEMRLNPGRKTKPTTLEIRVMDSNIPEYIMAVACLIKAVTLAWLKNKKQKNRMPYSIYLKSRKEAALKGMRAQLYWNGQWITAKEFLDRFVWTFRDEFEQMDIPHDLWMTFKLLKKGYNGSTLLFLAIHQLMKEHPPTWQRRFAKRYVQALNSLISGNSIIDFCRHLGVPLPNLDNLWLGRKNMRLL